jgi:alkylation response protein AidB-like acyl-CoA dehydrogenase
VASLTAAQRAVVERVETITREHVAPRAAEYDRAGANPVDSWRALWRDGFLGAAIPVANGGLGLDMATYVAVIRAIARGCANTAMTVHMHSTVMRFIDVLGTDAQKRRYFDEVVRHGVILARDAFLQKPFTPTSLVAKVRAAFAGNADHSNPGELG